jgi:hypothetical protein
VPQYLRPPSPPASISSSPARAVRKYFGRENLTPPLGAEIDFPKTSIAVP